MSGVAITIQKAGDVRLQPVTSDRRRRDRTLEVDMFVEIDYSVDAVPKRIRVQSWAATSEIASLDLDAQTYPLRATLTYVDVSFRAKNGDREGDLVAYSYPSLALAEGLL